MAKVTNKTSLFEESTNQGCPIILLGANPLYRNALESVIANQIHSKASASFFFFRGFSSVEEFKARLDDLSEPDHQFIIILLDEGGEAATTIKNIKYINKTNPTSKIIFISSNKNGNYIYRCIENGIHAYIFSDMSETLLIDCINLVVNDQMVFPSHLYNLGLGTQSQQPDLGSPINNIVSGGRISEKEANILGCLASGMSNKEISRFMSLPDPTTKLAVRKLLSKIGAKNRVQAAVWAEQNGYSPN